MIYRLCKTMILNKTYSTKEEMQTKLDVFYLGNRINQAQYEELTALLNEQ